MVLNLFNMFYLPTQLHLRKKEDNLLSKMLLTIYPIVFLYKIIIATIIYSYPMRWPIKFKALNIREIWLLKDWFGKARILVARQCIRGRRWSKVAS